MHLPPDSGPARTQGALGLIFEHDGGKATRMTRALARD